MSISSLRTRASSLALHTHIRRREPVSNNNNPSRDAPFSFATMRFAPRRASTPLWRAEPCSLPSRRPNQSQQSRPKWSRHHFSMERRLRRKRLSFNTDTIANNRSFSIFSCFFVVPSFICFIKYFSLYLHLFNFIFFLFLFPSSFSFSFFLVLFSLFLFFLFSFSFIFLFLFLFSGAENLIDLFGLKWLHDFFEHFEKEQIEPSREVTPSRPLFLFSPFFRFHFFHFSNFSFFS